MKEVKSRITKETVRALMIKYSPQFAFKSKLVLFEERRRKRSSSSSEREDKNKKNLPSPPRISMSFGKQSKPAQGIQIKLSSQPKPTTLVQKTTTVSKVFNDSDSEPEEMPAECRMRMRNIGKDTITSSGPNSFGKTKQGIYLFNCILFRCSLQ
jgi:PEST, proteolytic signal-containing nuclear protein family